MEFAWKFLALTLAVCAVVGIAEGRKELSEIVEDMFDNKNYDKRNKPDTDKSTKIQVSMYILDVFNVDEKNHEFTVQMYLRQHWVDGRLTFTPPGGVRSITLDKESMDKMWKPDTFIVNEKSSVHHDFTVLNEMTRVSADGEINRSVRVTVTASCKMDLKWFPFDKQLCTVELESYGSTADDFYYEWKVGTDGKPALGISEEAAPFSHKITEVRGVSASVSLTTGNYSRVSVQFLLSRSAIRYLQDVYFPATALPIIAFITMSVGALQFRVLLSTICMVGIIIFTSLLANQMPQVTYQTALDFYVFNSSVMILNVVIVNFVMYHLLKPKATAPRMRMRQMNGGAEDDKEILPEAEPSDNFNIGRPSFSNSFQEILYTLSEKSKYTMPIFFVVFNIIYWSVVLIASSFPPKNFLLTEDHGTN